MYVLVRQLRLEATEIAYPVNMDYVSVECNSCIDSITYEELLSTE